VRARRLPDALDPETRMTAHSTLRSTGLLAALLLAVAAGSPADAQSIVGTVADAETGSVLEGVHLVLVDSEGEGVAEAFTDDRGAFYLDVPSAGLWGFSAELIGYGTVASEVMEVGVEERVEVAIRMGIEAVPVDPIVVTSRIRSMNSEIQEFYDRMERGERSGMGQFITRDQIERRAGGEATDLFRTVGGVRIARGRPGRGRVIQMHGGCVPAVFIDGTQINRFDSGDSLDDYVVVDAIEGVEVYRGAGQQVGRFHDPGGCGVVLVWTRRGTDTGGEFSWARLAAGGALILGLLLLR
jgi:hypothetical protein